MKMSVTQPCPAGSVMLRDSRAWHGGTPNLSRFTRAIPVALYSLPSEDHSRSHSLPYETWERMTPMGQHICRYLVCDRGEAVAPTEWAPDWHNTRAIDRKAGPNSLKNGSKVDNPFAATAKL